MNQRAKDSQNCVKSRCKTSTQRRCTERCRAGATNLKPVFDRSQPERTVSSDGAFSLVAVVVPSTTKELQQLIEHANSGNKHALKRLRSFLDNHPEIWEQIGNLAQLAERTWMDLIANGNSLVMESLKRHIDKMKVDLAGENATAMETLLVDEIVACWLAVHEADKRSADSSNSSDRLTKRTEGAHKRYHSALRTLASLRTLHSPGLAPRRDFQLFEPTQKKA